VPGVPSATSNAYHSRLRTCHQASDGARASPRQLRVAGEPRSAPPSSLIVACAEIPSTSCQRPQHTLIGSDLFGLLLGEFAQQLRTLAGALHFARCSEGPAPVLSARRVGQGKILDARHARIIVLRADGAPSICHPAARREQQEPRHRRRPARNARHCKSQQASRACYSGDLRVQREIVPQLFPNSGHCVRQTAI